MSEFYRIPTTALVNIPTGDASSNLVAIVKGLGRTIKPVIVTKIGVNRETYEMEYRIVLNGEMAEAAKLAGVESVDAFQIDESDIETVAKLF